MSKLPTVINQFNVYKDDTSKLIGISGEVTLPDIENKSTTVSGAGLLGEIEEAITGQITSTKMEIPFAVLNDDIFSIMNPNESTSLTLRGAIQNMDTETSQAGYTGIKVTVKGKMSTFKPGKVKAGEQMGASVTIELTYIKISTKVPTDAGDKETVRLELDKLNGVYKINGKDVLGDVNKYI